MPRVPVTRERIVEAALEIVDSEGADALTARRLASRLDIKAPSLYAHVPSMDAVWFEIVAHLVRDIADVPLDGLTWREALRRSAQEYRRVLLTHPNVVPVFAQAALQSEDVVAFYDRIIEVLTDAGWSATSAMKISLGLDALMFGSAITPFAPSFTAMPPGTEGRFSALARTLAAVDVATIDEESFTMALDAFLAGLPEPERGVSPRSRHP
jgi:AcrR family transcriptional regulator